MNYTLDHTRSWICEDYRIQVLKQCTENVSTHFKLEQPVILTHIDLDSSTDLVCIVSGAEYCAIRTEDVNCFFDLFHCVSAREAIHNLHKHPVSKYLKLVAALQLVSAVMLSQYWAKNGILSSYCDAESQPLDLGNMLTTMIAGITHSVFQLHLITAVDDSSI